MRKPEYRVVEFDSKYYAQKKFLFWWTTMDLGDYYQRPAVFSTMGEARNWVIEYKLNKEQKNNTRVVWHDGEGL